VNNRTVLLKDDLAERKGKMNMKIAEADVRKIHNKLEELIEDL
jgi:hypothetical protein